jgi:hypothetical protein
MKTLGSAATVEIKLPPLPPGGPPQPFSSLVRVDLAGLSDQGKVRDNNEDHFLVGRPGGFLDGLQRTLRAGVVPWGFV